MVVWRSALQALFALLFSRLWAGGGGAAGGASKPGIGHRSLLLEAWVRRGRLVAAAVGVLCWNASLGMATVMDALAAAAVGPAVTVAGSVWLLGERMTSARWACFAMSALVSAWKPARRAWTGEGDGVVLFTAGPLLAAAAAVCFALTGVLGKWLVQRGGGQAGGVAGSMAWGLVACHALLAAGDLAWCGSPAPRLTARLVGVGAALGLLGAMADLCETLAFTRADVTFLSPLGVARPLLSAVLSWLLVRGDRVPPDAVVAAVAAACCAVLLSRERVKAA